MTIETMRAILRGTPAAGFDLYERRTGDYQLIVPIIHEDGDMIDIYLQASPRGDGFVRICDFGMTLMRLSYTFAVSTDTRQSILDSILINNRTERDGEQFYIDTPVERIYEGILQFAGCVQKACSMTYWNRETVRRTFYKDFDMYVTTELLAFSPTADTAPLPDYPLTVDWALTYQGRQFYTFGVLGNDKAKNVTIALLEFQQASLPFISLVVHEDIEALGRREQRYLMTNADTQYPSLAEFKERAPSDIERWVAVN